MKSTTRFIVQGIVLALLLFSSEGISQGAKNNKGASGGEPGYGTGFGLRGGWESGFTIKHFIKEKRAIEGILSRGWGYGGARITGLYEIHKPFPGVPNLDWFFGFGAHVGFFDGRYYGYYGHYNGGYYDKHGNWHPNGYRDYYFSLGIDGIIGLEYQIEEIPITLGFDLKPYFDIFGRGNHFGDGAFSIRYIIQ